MHRNNWLKIAGLAVPTLSAVLVFYVISSLSLLHSNTIEREAATRSAQYGKYAGDYAANHCVRVPRTEQGNCKIRAKQFARENQRQEEDLAAQKGSAWWAKVVGLTALGGTLISLIGVFLVWITFRETKRSNELLQHTMEPDLKVCAWVNCTIEVAAGLRVCSGQLNVLLKNHGSTAILNLQVSVLFDFPQGEEIIKIEGKKLATTRLSSNAEVSVDFGDGLLDPGIAVQNVEAGDKVCGQITVVMESSFGTIWTNIIPMEGTLSRLDASGPNAHNGPVVFFEHATYNLEQLPMKVIKG